MWATTAAHTQTTVNTQELSLWTFLLASTTLSLQQRPQLSIIRWQRLSSNR